VRHRSSSEPVSARAPAVSPKGRSYGRLGWVVTAAFLLLSPGTRVSAQQHHNAAVPDPRTDTLRAAAPRAGPLVFPAGPDSSVRPGAGTPAALPDSAPLPTDSAGSGGIDSVVTYSASDSIVFVLPTRTMSLYSRSRLRYESMELESERVDIDWRTATLHAHGIRDSSDTTGRRFSGTPVMKEAGEQYNGHELSYNFRTKRGKIDLGDTKIEDGFYHGEVIKKDAGGDLFVRDGRYTTCDLPDPHYFFGSPRMKVGVKDKIIAEPIYLYIADVPVFGLPFAVLPNRSGRRTGIIAPAFGDDSRRGKFLTHLGFYWATSDYMDVALKSDLYTKGGWALYGDYRYALRYNFTGSLNGDYKHLFTGEPSDPKRTEENSYRINMTHAQDFDPTTKLGVNFTFTSANSLLNSIDLAQALNQNIVSNATLSKSWEGTPNSVSFNAGRTQDLRNGNISEVLPSINFNHSQSFPFRSGGGGSGETTSWYEDIGLGYGANFTNRISAADRSVPGVKDTAGGLVVLNNATARETDRNRTLAQSLSLNFSPKLGHVTVAPAISYRDTRTFIENDVPGLNAADSSLQVSKLTSSQKSGVVTASISASTKFYGMAQPGILGISALRHTVTPNLSFSYSNPVIGDNRGNPTMAMNFGVGNVFEMKTAVPDSGEATKIQLMNLTAGSSYNFSADSLRLAPLSVSFRTGIQNVVDVDGGAVYDFYKLVETSPGIFTRVNRYLISDEGRLARLTTFRLSLSTKISGGSGGSGAASGVPPGGGASVMPGAVPPPPGTGFPTSRADAEPDFSIPWSLSLSLAYSESKVRPNPSRSSSLRGSLEFSLTEKWKVSTSGGYDVLARQLVAPDVTISRDLHCWFMNFYWVPTGPYRQYRFEIRVKASQLSDLKVTKQGSDRGFAQSEGGALRGGADRGAGYAGIFLWRAW
jgi:hypothetical protein